MLKSHLKTDLLHSLLTWFAADLISFLFMMLTFNFYKYGIAVYACLFIQVFFLGSLIFDSAQKSARSDRGKCTSSSDFSKKRCAFLSAVMSAPYILTWLLLPIDSIFSIDKLLPAYRFMNFFYNPIIYVFSGAIQKTSELSPVATAIMLLIGIAMFFVCYFTYKLTFQRFDIKKAVLYGK